MRKYEEKRYGVYSRGFKIELRLKWEPEMYADKLREKLNDLDAKGYDIISVSPMKVLGRYYWYQIIAKEKNK